MLLVRALAAAAVLLAGVLPAAAQEIGALKLGDTLSGTMEEGIEEVVPFDATEGTLVDIDLRMAPASGPALVLLQPDRTPYAGLAGYAAVDAKSSALKVRKVPLAQSGRHYILVRPAVRGAYAVTVKGKPPAKFLYAGFVFANPGSTVAFGSLPGTLATITAKQAQKSGLSPKVLRVLRPDGSEADLSRAASRVLGPSSDVLRSLPLDDLGRHVVVVGTTTGTMGAPGTIQVVLKFPKGKKVKALDGSLVVDPFVDEVQPASGFDNLAYDGVQLVGDFVRPGIAVALVGPETIPGTAVERASDKGATFDLDLDGRTPGAYDVVITGPDGAEGRLVGGFTVLPTPVPASILPASGFDNRTQSFTVVGTRFQQGLSLAIRPSAGGAATAAVVTASNDLQASVDLPLLDLPLGTFDLIAVNPDGGTRTLPAAFTVVRGPRFTGATPLLGIDNEAALAVSLTGAYFAPGLTCVLERQGQPSLAAIVTGVSAASATAAFDLRGKAAGAWTLRVTNPDGGTIAFPTSFTISKAPAPGVLAGTRYLEGESGAGSLAGTAFAAGAQVVFEGPGGTISEAANEAVGGGGTTLTFDIAAAPGAVGDNDVRVTNPDGGTALSPTTALVLGTRTLTSEGVSAGRPAIAYDAEDDVYLAVYSVFDGTQSDIRALRFSGATGKPVGEEIVVTSSALESSSTESQTSPCASYAPELDAFLVGYAWQDPNADGLTVKVKFQLVNRDGTLNGNQFNALTVHSVASGTVRGVRAAWNATRKEWLLVFGMDNGADRDVGAACIGEGFVLGDPPVRSPDLVWSGVLVGNTHTISTQGGPATINDRDQDPDVAWSPTRNEYLVAYAYDFVEAGSNPPADTGVDVQARIFSGSFASGPVSLATLTNLGNFNGKDDGLPRVASGGDSYLVAWELRQSAGNRDVQCGLVNAVTRAKVGASTTVDPSAPEDVAGLAVCWDATPSATGYVIASTRVPGGSGTSSILSTRFPQSGTGALGAAVQKVLAPAVPGVSFEGPDLAGRGSGGEFMAGWTVSGEARAPADAEVRVAR